MHLLMLLISLLQVLVQVVGAIVVFAVIAAHHHHHLVVLVDRNLLRVNTTAPSGTTQAIQWLRVIVWNLLFVARLWLVIVPHARPMMIKASLHRLVRNLASWTCLKWGHQGAIQRGSLLLQSLMDYLVGAKLENVALLLWLGCCLVKLGHVSLWFLYHGFVGLLRIIVIVLRVLLKLHCAI